MKCTHLILAALILFSASALAERGGDSGAGGNTINYKVISRYVLRDSDPVYQELQAYLDRLPKVEVDYSTTSFPDLVRDALKNATIYEIPEKIQKLPESHTGLHFPTEQSAYQRGREIFISQSARNRMSREEFAELLFQEALEQLAGGGSKEKMVKSREVMGAITRSDGKLSGEELAKKVNYLLQDPQSGFGTRVMSVEEKERIAAHERDLWNKRVAEWKSVSKKLFTELEAEMQKHCAGEDAKSLEQFADFLLIDQDYYVVKDAIGRSGSPFRRDPVYQTPMFEHSFGALTERQKENLTKALVSRIAYIQALEEKRKDDYRQGNLLQIVANQRQALHILIGNENAERMIKEAAQDFGREKSLATAVRRYKCGDYQARPVIVEESAQEPSSDNTK